MRDWLYPGAKVVCVEYDGRFVPPPHLAVGHIYTVSWVGVWEEGPRAGDLAVDVVENPAPETELAFRGYGAECFRPLRERKTDISIFEALLTPSDATEDA